MQLLDVADMISAVRSIFRTNMRYFQMARSAAAQAMPVIFTTVEQFEIWLSGRSNTEFPEVPRARSGDQGALSLARVGGPGAPNRFVVR